MKYQILMYESPFELMEVVEEFMAKEWEPVGGVAAYGVPFTFAQ